METRDQRRADHEAKMAVKRNAILAGLKASVEAAGRTFAYTEADVQRFNRIEIGGEPVYGFRLTEERSAGSARYYTAGISSGRLRLIFGDYGKARQFPEPKAGFDFAKLAAELIACVDAQITDRAREEQKRARRDSTTAAAEVLNTQLSCSKYSNLRAAVDSYGHLTVAFPPLTATQAEAVLRAAIAAGVKVG